MATTTTVRQWTRLATATAIVGFVWLVVLPLVGADPRVTEHVARQQRLGIDPSALFYTELEIASGIAQHVERLHDSHSDRFWSVSGRTSSEQIAAETRNSETP